MSVKKRSLDGSYTWRYGDGRGSVSCRCSADAVYSADTHRYGDGILDRFEVLDDASL